MMLILEYLPAFTLNYRLYSLRPGELILLITFAEMLYSIEFLSKLASRPKVELINILGSLKVP